MDPVARAKSLFFACLGASIALLLLVDLYVGPSAFAVPEPPPSAAPSTAVSPSSSPSTAASTPSSVSSRPANPPPQPEAVDAAAPPATTSTTTPDLDPQGHYTGVVAVFEFEQANADLERIKVVAKQMHADTSSQIVLEGHSDPSGNEYKNLSLSLDRANWVADRLVEYGIDRMRMRTVGLGSARPIVDIGGDAGAVNRRVEVRWILRSADGGGR